MTDSTMCSEGFKCRQHEERLLGAHKKTRGSYGFNLWGCENIYFGSDHNGSCQTSEAFVHDLGS